MVNTAVESRRVGPWPGGWRWSDGELGVGQDELWVANNVLLGAQGEVRKRPGFSDGKSTNHPGWDSMQLRHWQLRLSSGDYYDIILDAVGTFYSTPANSEQDFQSGSSSATSNPFANADSFWTGSCIYKDALYVSSWRTNGAKKFNSSGWANITDNALDGTFGEFPLAKHLLVKHDRVFAANCKVLPSEIEMHTPDAFSVETGIGDWEFIDGSTSISQQMPPVSAPDGTYALEVNIISGPAMAWVQEATATAKATNIVEPGEVYTISFKSLAGATARSLRIGYTFFNSSDVAISSGGQTAGANNTSTWTSFSYVTPAAPANATYMKMTMGLAEPGATNEKHYYDEMSIKKGDALSGEVERRSRIYFSEPGDAEQWGVLNWIDVNPEDGGQITGLASFGEWVVIFKESAVYLLAGVDKNTFTLFPLDSTVGSVSPYTIVGSSTHLYWYDYLNDHVYRFNGSSIEAIDEKIFGYMSKTINRDSGSHSFTNFAATAAFYKDHYFLSYYANPSIYDVFANHNRTIVFNSNLRAWTLWEGFGFMDSTVDNTDPATRSDLFYLNVSSGNPLGTEIFDGLQSQVWSNDLRFTWMDYSDGGRSIECSVVGPWYPASDGLVGQETVRLRKVTVLVRTTNHGDFTNDLNVYLDTNYDRGKRTSQVFDMHSDGSGYGMFVGMEVDINPLWHPGNISAFSLAFYNNNANDTFELWGADVSSSARRRGLKRGFDTNVPLTDVFVELVPASVSATAQDFNVLRDFIVPVSVSLVPVDIAVGSPLTLTPVSVVLLPSLITVSAGSYVAAYGDSYGDIGTAPAVLRLAAVSVTGGYSA